MNMRTDPLRLRDTAARPLPTWAETGAALRAALG